MPDQRTITVIPQKPSEQPSRDHRQQKLRVAAYFRVSTDDEEQLSSYKSQVDYYTNLIRANPNWKFAGVFADEGLSGTSTKSVSSSTK